MAVNITRKLPGAYQSAHFTIHRAHQVRQKRFWEVEAYSALARALYPSKEICGSLAVAQRRVVVVEQQVAAWIRAHGGFVQRKEITISKMVAGNEYRYTFIIDKGRLKQWRIWWVDEREATLEDYEHYPVCED